MPLTAETTADPVLVEDILFIKAPRILLIASASRPFTRTLANLKKEFPEALVTVLAPPNLLQGLRQDPRIEALLALPAGRRVSWFSFGPLKRQDLRRRKFDMAVCLYNTEHGLGYANINFLAWCTGASTIRGYFPDGSFHRMTLSKIIRRYAKERLAWGWVGLNLAAALVQLTVFGLAMILEAACRRLGLPLQSPTDAPHHGDGRQNEQEKK